MNYKRIVELLEDQLRLSSEREMVLLEQNRQQSAQLQQQSAQIERLSVQTAILTDTVRSLEESLLQKKGDIQVLTGKKPGTGQTLVQQIRKDSSSNQRGG